MLIKILFSYLLGYITITVEGYYIERFINICNVKKIPIWSLKRHGEINVVLKTRVKEFKEICNIAKKVKCKVKINSKRGLPFVIHKYKKRKIFAILLIVLLFLIVFSSNFIWNIEIKEENGLKLENLEQDIEEAGLKIGEWKSKVNTKEIINKTRFKRSDIAWMGIELKGTNVIVRVVKATNKPEIVDKNELCNIVSDKTGVITKINAQTGTANVKVGDVVNSGDILINGWMEGKYTGIRYVHAEGEVQAKVWYTKNKLFCYNTTERIETGNTENKYSIKLNNFRINFYKRLSNFKIYDKIDTENKLQIFSDFYLPISVIKTTNKEVEEKQKQYNYEEIKKIGTEEVERELYEEIENKESIINKNINIHEEEDGLDIYVTYEVLENIGTNEKIVF